MLGHAFYHHNRIVHHNADCEDYSEKGEEVDAETHHCHCGEGLGTFSQPVKCPKGRQQTRSIAPHLMKHHEAPGMRIRQRAQEHTVDDAEHRRRRTDAECERRHRDDAERRRARERSRRKPSVAASAPFRSS